MYLLYVNFDISLKYVLKQNYFVCSMLLVSLIKSWYIVTVIQAMGKSGAFLTSSCLQLQNIPLAHLTHNILKHNAQNININTVIPRLTSDPANEFFG